MTFEAVRPACPRCGPSAPGRVNLMGDHTDYNAGLVLPAAIPQRTEIAIAARDDRTVRLWSDQFRDEGLVHVRARRGGARGRAGSITSPA